MSDPHLRRPLTNLRRLRLRLAMWFAYRICAVPVDVRSAYFTARPPTPPTR